MLEKRTVELDRSLAMLRATIESTADGLLVTDESGRCFAITSFIVDMWPIPRELMEDRETPLLIEYCSII